MKKNLNQKKKSLSPTESFGNYLFPEVLTNVQIVKETQFANKNSIFNIHTIQNETIKQEFKVYKLQVVQGYVF